jgi:hypothetical protein
MLGLNTQLLSGGMESTEVGAVAAAWWWWVR